MRAWMVAMLAGTALSVAATPAPAQEKLRAEVMHWWTSGGEAAAVKVLAEAFDKAGGEWVDTAIANGENARAAAINRIVGGNPPAASQFNTGKQFDDLVAQNLLRSLDSVAEAGHWKDFLPPAFVQAASRDGHFYAVPINVHGQNWMFYSKAVLAKAGVAAPPKTWDEFFAAMDKIKAAGLIPIALGGQPWQEHVLFNAVLLSVSKDVYMKAFGERSVDAVKSPEFRKAVDIFGRMRGYVDPGSPGRNWNDATALLITNKAGVQVMGDWMKGEFKAAGQTADKDYACVVGLDDTSLMIGGDVFVFPKLKDAAGAKAQDLLATVMLDPKTQVEFNNQKGSMPVRADVDTSSMDPCAQKGLGLLKDRSRQVPSIDMLVSADLIGTLDDVLTEFWNDKAATSDQLIERIAKAMQSAG